MGVNQDSNRGIVFKKLTTDTSSSNEKLQYIAGNYVLANPLLNLKIKSAALKVAARTAYADLKDVDYFLQLKCVCTDASGIIMNDEVNTDVLYPKRFDEQRHNQFNDLLVQSGAMSNILFSSDEMLPVNLMVRLTSDQVIGLLKSKAYEHDDFNRIFSKALQEQPLRLSSEFKMPIDVFTADASLFDDNYGNMFVGAAVSSFDQMQYYMADDKFHDFEMFAQSDFPVVFAKSLSKVCDVFHLDQSFISDLYPENLAVDLTQLNTERTADTDYLSDSETSMFDVVDVDVDVKEPTLEVDDAIIESMLGSQGTYSFDFDLDDKSDIKSTDVVSNDTVDVDFDLDGKSNAVVNDIKSTDVVTTDDLEIDFDDFLPDLMDDVDDSKLDDIALD